MSKQLRVFIYVICCSLLRISFGYCQIPGDAFFGAPVVHEVSITFSDPDWYNTLVQYKWFSDNLDSNVYLPASITIDGTALDSVGIRFKGNSSYYNYPSIKKPFKLDFNEFVSGQKFDGLKKINLNNLYQDPTFMREKLFLDFIQQHGLNGPRATYANLTINGDPWGLYLAVDQIDKTFLDRTFNNKNGNLFKGDNNTSSCANLRYHTSINSYFNCYELKTNNTANNWEDLVDLTFRIDQSSATQFRDSVDLVLNSNSFISAWACYTLFANFDSYPYRYQHNYYLYHDTIGNLLEWIVWDVSTAFGLDIPLTTTQVEELSIYNIWANGNDRPLSTRMLQNGTFRQNYTDRICEFVEYFDPAIQFPVIDSLLTVIQSAVYADPFKMYSNQQFDDNILNTTNINGSDIPGLRSFISARYANVLNELSNENCTTTGIDNELAAQGGSITIFPNPFSLRSSVINTTANGPWSWELYNAIGQIVQRVEHIKGDQLTIYKGNLPKGLYVYRIESADAAFATGSIAIE